MGRAYEVRKVSMQKTGAAKAKLYSLFSKEIYQAAKQGGTNPDSNDVLKRLIERARKEQIPNDIIKRAIDKVSSGIDENYTSVTYEVFGPNGSTLIVECLTDNVNRTLSYIRPALNKNGGKMGVTGSVVHMYDHMAVITFKEISGSDETKVLDLMIENDIDLSDIEVENEFITLYGKPEDLYNIKEAIKKEYTNVEFVVDAIMYLPSSIINLEGEDKEKFDKMYEMLDEVEDVQKIYHNVA